MKFSIVLAFAFATQGLSSPTKLGLEDSSALKIIHADDHSSSLEARQGGCPVQEGTGCLTLRRGDLCCCSGCTVEDCNLTCRR
ncbi:hypothetical protein Alg215_10770 [Pyrenophora tritici-repentis]|nr:hypothetical protein Alg215_10770 [Pyrenophora tritici-repentis]